LTDTVRRFVPSSVVRAAPEANRRAAATKLSGWIAPTLILAAWQAGSSLGYLSGAVLPSPASVLAAGWRLTRSGELPVNMGISFCRAMAGLIVGGGIGLALGLMNGLSKLSESLSDSTLQMVRNVPHLALIPLVIV
jgi:sulfonate transport system permease protein